MNSRQMLPISKKLIIGLAAALIINLGIAPRVVSAQVPSACNQPGWDNLCGAGCGSGLRCVTSVANQRCDCRPTSGGGTNPDDPFGPITPPIPGTLIGLLSNVLRLIFVGAGVFAFIRIVIAGLGFLGAGGDPKRIEQAWGSIWQSLLGLIIIVASFAIAAIAGQVLFGRADAILNPQIYGPQQPAP